MIIDNTAIPAKALRLFGMVRYLEDMKFQAYHVCPKGEAENMKTEFSRLLAVATDLAKELAKEYPVYTEDMADDTYRMLFGVDKPQKESKADWLKRQIAEDRDIY